MTHLGFFGDLNSGFQADIKESANAIFISMVVALVLSLIALFLTSFFISWLIWVQIVAFVITCIILGVACWVLALKDYTQLLIDNKWKPYLVKKVAQIHNNKTQMLIYGTLLILLGLCIAIATYLNRRSFKKAAAILRFAVKVAIRHLHLVVLGLICFMCQIVSFFTGVWILVGIYTSGELIRDTKVGSPIQQFKVGMLKWCLISPTIFATYWITSFFNNFCDMATAGTTANDYFKKSPRFFGALKNIIIYHLGSVSLCSIILGPITLFQGIFGAVYDLLTVSPHEEPTKLHRIANKLCICVLFPYRKWFLRTIESGLGMVYMSSSDYCPSSKEAFYLLRSYSLNIGRLELVTNLYRIVMVLSIAVMNSLIFNWILSNWEVYVRTVSNPYVPTIVIFILSLLISVIFMNIYNTISDTSVLCYLIEIDVGNKPTAEELHELIQAEQDDPAALIEKKGHYDRMAELEDDVRRYIDEKEEERVGEKEIGDKPAVKVATGREEEIVEKGGAKKKDGKKKGK